MLQMLQMFCLIKLQSDSKKLTMSSCVLVAAGGVGTWAHNADIPAAAQTHIPGIRKDVVTFKEKT